MPLTFPDSEEEDELSFLPRVGLSGLSMVGNLLDLPGSMIRDVASPLLTGEFRNPFDQLLHPLSQEDRVGGRELLHRSISGFVQG